MKVDRLELNSKIYGFSFTPDNDMILCVQERTKTLSCFSQFIRYLLFHRRLLLVNVEARQAVYSKKTVLL